MLGRGGGRIRCNLTIEQYEYIRNRYIDDCAIYMARLKSLVDLDLPDESLIKAVKLLLKEFDENSLKY